MSTSVILDDILGGFLFALPFVWVRRYRIRLMLSIGIPLLGYIGLIAVTFDSHMGTYWENDRALRILIGALLAAHVRTAWELIWSLARRLRT